MIPPVFIKNGTIVNAHETLRVDLLIENGVISRMGSGHIPENARVIDAGGNFVMPGGVDVHTHLNLDTGFAKAQDDFFTGTRAAAFGGTTTIVDHPGFGPEGCDLRHQIDVNMAQARDKAVVDYSVHGVFQTMDEGILVQIGPLVAEGFSSFKAYLTYAGKLDDHEILQALEALRNAGGLLTVHAENDAVIRFLQKRFIEGAKTAPIYHARSRPAGCEAEAVHRMVHLASVAKTPLYIVHLSTARGLDAVKAARKAGQPVYVETCPQYLLLDERCYEEPDSGGFKYIMSPPLRTKDDRDALWQGIASGDIDVIATDHCPFDFAKKRVLGKDDFTQCPGGIPGIELRMALMFSEGVAGGRIDVQRFVELVSTAPAKIMGLFPRKGVIAPGADGDVVLMDPGRQVTVTHGMLHENVDYTPYEAMRLTGWPVLTLVRGRVVVENGQCSVQKGYGRFVKRGPVYRDDP